MHLMILKHLNISVMTKVMKVSQAQVHLLRARATMANPEQPLCYQDAGGSRGQGWRLTYLGVST